MKKYLKLLRISQWIKNFFIFVPLIFSKNLFNYDTLLPSFLAFLAFCLVSAAVYIVNDIADVKEDMMHPVKRLRPVASGLISIRHALVLLVFLSVAASALLMHLNLNFRLFAAGYIVINLLYTFALKKIVILDLFCIASGFIIRVLGGAYVINVEISSWLILTTMFLSLFLAIMKRQSELSWITSETNGDTRKVLQHYSLEFTKQMGTISAAGVIICYALYTVAERTIKAFHNDLFVYTTVFVVFGIFRFMYLVYQHGKGENATEMMITDIGMIINIILYIIISVIIIYF